MRLTGQATQQQINDRNKLADSMHQRKEGRGGNSADIESQASRLRGDVAAIRANPQQGYPLSADILAEAFIREMSLRRAREMYASDVVARTGRHQTMGSISQKADWERRQEALHATLVNLQCRRISAGDAERVQIDRERGEIIKRNPWLKLEEPEIRAEAYLKYAQGLPYLHARLLG